MSLGPVMLDVEGLELNAEDREVLRHPQVGGVILFARNYHSPEQLQDLLTQLHRLREPRLVIAVDQEGGRIQRFREGFTKLPPARRLGEVYDRDPGKALALAQQCGWLMAVELLAVGVDLSLAPVLDLDWGKSGVIGDRAFHRQAEIVSDLAQAYVAGMHKGGMAATGKHFPGHGGVRPDSHTEIAEDPRPYAELLAEDLVPFARLAHAGLAAIMPAHVIYPSVDRSPAGFSAFWLRTVLRERLEFQGVILSDDLGMFAASVMGSLPDRAMAALEAGCDMVLPCNDRAAAIAVLESLAGYNEPVSHLRLVRLHGRPTLGRTELMHSPAWRQAVADVEAMGEGPHPRRLA